MSHRLTRYERVKRGQEGCSTCRWGWLNRKHLPNAQGCMRLDCTQPEEQHKRGTKRALSAK